MEARGLGVGYGREPVLDALSFTFEAGGINVILGPGGTGKSTLLRAMGADPGSSASPWMRGELLLPEAPPASMAQKPRPPSVPLARLLDSAGDGQPARLLEEIWRGAPRGAELLRQRIEVPMDRLPFPEIRLAELTVALAGPSFVLLDEPEVGLEDEIREWMMRCLEDQRGRRTVVLATHHLGFARGLADYALLVSDGGMVECGPSPPFFDRPRSARTRRFVKMGS